MTFESFKALYLAISLLGAGITVWSLRKKRDELLVLVLMSFMMGLFIAAFYFDVKEDRLHDAEFLGYLLTGLTHVQDSVLIVCNVILWGVVPFGIAIRLRPKKNGSRPVLIFFIGFTLLRTLVEDRFLIHQYPEVLTHQYEWGFVLFDWLIIYLIAGLFITKGIKALTEEKHNDQSPH